MSAVFSWLKNVPQTIAARIWKMASCFTWFLGLCIQTFFGTSGIKGTAVKAGKVSLANIFFRIYENGIFLTTATIVSSLKYLEWTEPSIFLLLWILNMGFCFSEFFIYDKTQIDFTLVAGYRRMVDAVWILTKPGGTILEFICAVKLLFWDSVTLLLIFMEKRIDRFILRSIVFVLGSFAQMALWTWLFSIGYDGLMPLAKDFYLSYF